MADVASALAQEPGVEPVMFNPLRFGGNAIRSAVAAALALPGRAMTAAGDLQRGGEQGGLGYYDPAPAVDAAMMTMGGTAFGAPKGAVGAGPPIRAYHGSPHDFDRFDMSKIGTGEGAQAYGHGLYFAENPEVARQYREALAGAPTVKFQGSNQPTAFPAAWEAVRKFQKDNPIGPVESGVRGDVMKSVANHLIEDSGQMITTPKYVQEVVDSYPEAVRPQITQWANETISTVRPHLSVERPGRMYEVNINAAPEHFLDWDKPLAGQPQTVRGLLEQRGAEVSPRTTGEDIYRYTLPSVGIGRGSSTIDAGAITNTLADAGIPGIRYLDQGSRGAGTTVEIMRQKEIAANAMRVAEAQPEIEVLRHIADAEQLSLERLMKPQTSNYVLFRDDIINILRKYQIAGITPPAALLAAAQQQGGGEQQ